MTRELLFRVTKKDLEITPIRGSGPGGQHRNKTSTGIRMRHPASGAVVEATDSKSRETNQRNAFLRLIETPAFRLWFNATAREVLGRESVEHRVEREMRPENIQVQTLDERERWVDWPWDTPPPDGVTDE